MFPITTPLSLILRRLPDPLHEGLFAALFNHMMQQQPLNEQLAELNGKVIRISILDTHTELLFRVVNGGLSRVRDRQTSDARIAGNLADFLLLASRAEDPDTLFFQRRLILEGETETGLYIKNMLDALEFDWRLHLQAVLGKPRATPLIHLIERGGLDQRLEQHFPILRGF